MCGRLKLQGAVPGLGETVRSPDPAVRLASVLALAEVASPGALTAMELAIDDDDRAVRLAAVRAMGAKGIRNALKRIEPVILGKSTRDLDLTEKMAFFEAYGGIAGPTAIPTLQSMLLSRGLLGLQGRSRHARLRGGGAGADPHARGARGAAEGGGRQGPRGAAGGEPRAPGPAVMSAGMPNPRQGEPPTQDGALRTAGRGLLLDLYAALRSLKLYPVENATVQKALDDLQATAVSILRTETEVEIRLAGDFIFINQTRLRLELDNYASFSQILAQFRAYEIGVIRVHPGVERREWQAFLSVLLSLQARAGRRGGLRGGAEPPRGRRGDAPRDRAGAAERGEPRGPGAAEGSRQAHLCAGRGGDARGDHQHPDGAGERRQEGEARGADDRGPGAQQRDLDRRAHDHPRLRRVHVHPLGERVHLLGGAGQEAEPEPAAAVRPRHDGADARPRQGARVARDPQQDDQPGRRRVAR